MSKPIGKPGVDSPDDASSPGDPNQTPRPGEQPSGSPAVAKTRTKKAVRPSGIPLPTPRANPQEQPVDAPSPQGSVTPKPPAVKPQVPATQSASSSPLRASKESDLAPGESSDDAIPSLKDLAARNAASIEVDPEPIRPLEDLHTPERKLVLNDLFDSAPPEGSISLAPPNPTAFWSSKPPAAPSEPPPPAQRERVSDPPPRPATPQPPEDLLASSASEEMPSVDETIPLDLQSNHQPPAPPNPPEAPPSPTTPPPGFGGAENPALKPPAQDDKYRPGSSEDQAATEAPSHGSQSQQPPRTPAPPRARQQAASPTTTEESSKPGRATATTLDESPAARRARLAQKAGAPSVPEAQLTSPAAPPSPSSPEPEAQAAGGLPSVVVADQRQRAERAAKATRIIAIPDEVARAVQASAVARAEASNPRPAAHTPGKRLGSAHTTRSLWIAAAGMFALAAILIVYRFSVPSTGSLVVTAQGPGGGAVEEVSITIQGVTCGTSPCIISQIAPGEHLLQVSGKGVDPTEDRVQIEAGREVVHNVVLRRHTPAAPKTSGVGSLEIAAGDEPLTMYLDRKPIGRLPQHVDNISTGKHWLQLKSDDGSEAVARWIKIEEGQTLNVPPEPEPSAFGKVTISLKPSSRGAAVTLDDAFILDFPAEIELEPGVTHRLSASKAGFRDYSTEIEVEAGQPPETIEIDLRKGSSRRSRKAARSAKRRRSRTKASRKSPKATVGKLTLRSTPPSNVILDGRPIGKTPKLGLEVSGNSLHTIVFVHPSKGRKRAQKYVKAGESESVSIKF